MLLVVGSALDDEPQLLVDRWRDAGRDVALVTPGALSRPGWRLRAGRPDLATAAVGDRVVPAAEIEGVVVALDVVVAYELRHVVEDDRDYVAQEMTAFLLAWLSALRCRVLDRPTARSLAGCGRTDLEWSRIAASAGVEAAAGWSGPTVPVTVVDGHAVGDVPAGVAEAAVAIARAAGRCLVTLRFASDGRARLVGAEPRPAVGRDAVAAHLLQVLDA